MLTHLRHIARRPSSLILPLVAALSISIPVIQAEDLSDKNANAKTLHAEKQYVTALLTAISAAQVNHSQMATFANQHLHQATYCIYLTDPAPLATIAKLTRRVMSDSDDRLQIAHFEKIKTDFDMEYVRGEHPCLQGSFPEDRV